MILKIKDALDTICPDQNLINRTELLLRSNSKRRKQSSFRSVAIAASLLMFAGVAAHLTPVAYLDVDINPSMELAFNIFNKVVDVTYFNTDAEELISEESLKGCAPEEAVTSIMSAAEEQGYLSQDEITVVSLAINGRTFKKGDAVIDLCAEAVSRGFDDVAVYKASVTKELRTEAETNSISPGKLHLIKMVQELDQSASVDEYRDKSVTEIFGCLSALSSADSDGVSEETRSEVRNNIEGIILKLDISETAGADSGNITELDTQSPKPQAQTENTSSPVSPGTEQQGSLQPETNASAPQPSRQTTAQNNDTASGSDLRQQSVYQAQEPQS